MAKCDCCGKGVTFGIKVSHSHRRSNRTWKPNVKRVKAVVEGSPKYIYACTRCLRSGKVTGHSLWPAFVVHGGIFMTCPSDPVMLLSYINTQLRDHYESLAALCEDLDLSEAALKETLAAIGYEYNREQNRFA